jgi:hypothetical protein
MDAQLLIWQPTVLLKQLCLEWLCLGGLSEDHTLGVASVKLGMGGDWDELIGGGWKW